jgi:hypothetical protein
MGVSEAGLREDSIEVAERARIPEMSGAAVAFGTAVAAAPQATARRADLQFAEYLLPADL